MVGKPFEAAAQRHRRLKYGRCPPRFCRRRKSGSGATFCSSANLFDNQMPSKLFGYLGTGKPLLHLAVTDTDPTLPLPGKSIPLALVLHKKERRNAGSSRHAATLAD